MGLNKSSVIALGLMITAALSGCLNGRADAPAVATKATAQQADDLVDRAEKLMTPLSMVEANDLIKMAIGLNPQNIRAQYYAHSLNVPMQLKGILARIDSHLVQQMPEEFQQNYAQMLEQAHTLPTNIQNFLFDGRVDVSTEGEVQDVVAQMTDAMAQQREFLIANKDQTITVRAYAYSNMSDSGCHLVQTNPIDAHLEGCGDAQAQSVTLERPDIEMLALYTGGYEVLSAMATTYDATGLISFGEKARANAWTADQTIAAIDQGDGISLNVRKNNRWGDFLKVSADGLQMVEYARSIQKDACPNGVPTKKTVLWPQGLCIPETVGGGRSLESLLHATELSLEGTPMDIQFTDAQNHPNSTRVNLHSLFAQAPPHQSLMPSHVTECGQTTGFFDPTIAGLFPNGDVNILLAHNDQSCHPGNLVDMRVTNFGLLQ